MTAQQVRDLLASGRALTIIDVRSGIHRKLDPVAIPGAHLMRLDHLGKETAEFARREEIVTYCACPNDATAVRAGEVLRMNGFTNVHVLQGGIDAWRHAGYGVQSIASPERESEPGREPYPS